MTAHRDPDIQPAPDRAAETLSAMRPADVPDELIRIAQEAWRTAPQKRDGQPTRMRYALAAAWPEITRRYRVALNAANAMERVYKRNAERHRQRADQAEAERDGNAYLLRKTEDELHQARQRAERAEADLAQLRAYLADAIWAAYPNLTPRQAQVARRWADRYGNAEQNRAAVERVQALAQAAKERAATSLSRQFGGAPLPALVRADDVLAALNSDQPKEETR